MDGSNIKSTISDAELARDLAGWRVGVDALTQQVIGRSAVFLQGLKAVCRQQECNLGMYRAVCPLCVADGA